MKHKGLYRILACLGLAAMLLTLACAPKATPAPVAPTPAKPSQAAWELEWARVVAAAQREGRVVVYTPLAPEARTALGERFKEKYGIAVEWVSASPSALTQKVLTERRAGIYDVDVIVTGTSTQAATLKPAGVTEPLESTIILPEVKDPNAWYGGDLLWVDKGRHLLGFLGYLEPALVINTDVVKEGEIKAYKDLLDPKWKKRIIIQDPTIAGSALWWFSAVSSRIMDIDYMRQLARQEPVVSRDFALAGRWLAQGKYPVGIAIKTGVIAELIKAGAPVKVVIPEEGTYLVRGGGIVSLVNRAPHPNTARAFINWLLTREAQAIYSKAELSQSARNDVPADFLQPALRRDPKIRYVYAEDEEAIELIPQRQKQAKEIFGPLVSG